MEWNGMDLYFRGDFRSLQPKPFQDWIWVLTGVLQGRCCRKTWIFWKERLRLEAERPQPSSRSWSTLGPSHPFSASGMEQEFGMQLLQPPDLPPELPILFHAILLPLPTRISHSLLPRRSQEPIRYFCVSHRWPRFQTQPRCRHGECINNYTRC